MCAVCAAVQCVLRMDHYCIWMDQCIGRLNHHYFLRFLLLYACGATAVATFQLRLVGPVAPRSGGPWTRLQASLYGLS